MGVRRSIAVMGVIAGIAALAVFATAALAGPDFLRSANADGRDVPPCPKVIGAEPVDMSRCRHRVVTSAAKPEPYPVIPALFPAPGKP